MLAASRLIVFVLVEQGGDVDFQWPSPSVELDVVRRYLTMLVVPVGQSIFHAITPMAGWFQPRAIADLALFAAGGWLMWTSGARARS